MDSKQTVMKPSFRIKIHLLLSSWYNTLKGTLTHQGKVAVASDADNLLIMCKLINGKQWVLFWSTQSTKSSAKQHKITNKYKIICLGNLHVLVIYVLIPQILPVINNAVVLFLCFIPKCTVGLQQASKLYFEWGILIRAHKNLYFASSTHMHVGRHLHTHSVSFALNISGNLETIEAMSSA